ncbi:hypothetical protein ACFQY5_40180 [Paeniroseomonas aquatica]|uniref:Uncharacterized protein n=1 Tax=Paeniroseomonas aquatica TaxID=373043 RepID=A0ABT8A082_9PROT|nr:hypothetical protein [Paeniroseomonas aquatica]MDN3563140.1 hypothetical protein [Paeniroseomonas aquatica]
MTRLKSRVTLAQAALLIGLLSDTAGLADYIQAAALTARDFVQSHRTTTCPVDVDAYARRRDRMR